MLQNKSAYKFSIDDVFFYPDKFPYNVASDKTYWEGKKMTVEYKKPETEVFTQYLKQACHHFNTSLKLFQSNEAVKTTFITKGFHSDSVLDMCRDTYDKYHLHYRITPLPFDWRPFERIESSMKNPSDGIARIIGFPMHCLVEVSLSNIFKLGEPFDDLTVVQMVHKHYLDFDKSLNFFVDPVDQHNNQNVQEIQEIQEIKTN